MLIQQIIKILKKQKLDIFSLIIISLALLSYARILLLLNVFEDDNAWLLSVYASSNLSEFLNTGWIELRRIPQGVFLYYFLGAHRLFDNPYILWQSLNLLIQVASPLLLYYFLNNLIKNKYLAFLSACSFIVYPIDTTLPVFSNIYYRIGIMLTIISFYLTERGLSKDIRWVFLFISFLLSGISHYILIEGTIALEPARLFFIGYIFYNKGIGSKDLIKKTLIVWLPFLLLCIPLIIYKLIFKPYGIYADMYKTDISFLLNLQMYKELTKMLLFGNWKVLFLKYLSHLTTWSILSGVFTVIIVIYIIRRSKVSGKLNLKIANQVNFNEWADSRSRVLIFVFFGIVLLIPPVIMYGLAGRVPSFGPNSRHGVILQMGYAITLGSILYAIYRKASKGSGLLVVNLFIAIFFALGVFFNNINLDIYFNAWEKQKDFWQAFTKRFPTLPEKTNFFLVVGPHRPMDHLNIDTYYDLEFVINMLYTKSKDPKRFRNYNVIAVDELESLEGHVEKSNKVFKRSSHWGEDVFDLKEIVVIYYSKNKLLVNHEVIEQYPDITYRILADKDFPELPESASYPLRKKLSGFY